VKDQLKELINRLDASSWDSWKKSLGKLANQAEKSGVSKDILVEFAAEFGDFLTKNVKPDVPENIAMKELWEAANEEEQKVLARLMLKITK